MPGYNGSKYANNVFTAPLAIIEIGGVSIGMIQSLTFTENVQRGEVQGLGELLLREVPPLSIRCSFQANSYLIELKKLGDVPDPFWPQGTTTRAEFTNTMLLGEVPVNLHVYSKIPKTWNGKIVSDIDKFKMGVAANCVLDSRSFTINEQQVGGKNISGRYLEPIQM